MLRIIKLIHIKHIDDESSSKYLKIDGIID